MNSKYYILSLISIASLKGDPLAFSQLQYTYYKQYTNKYIRRVVRRVQIFRIALEAPY
jgi:hypothetical protein